MNSQNRSQNQNPPPPPRAASVWEAVGNTPMLVMQSFEKMTGHRIFGKAEYLNPGGSIKDRAAKGLIEYFEEKHQLRPGDTLVEGTAGNTGIGLLTLAAARGYKVCITIAENQAAEKFQILEAFGAEIIKTPAVPFSDSRHFVHEAKRIAASRERHFYVDQFENTANADFHFRTTGPEIWEQCEGKIDAVVMAIGSGGTISGVSRYLKSKDSKIQIVAADPEGSGIYSYVNTGELKAAGSSLTEGIGIMRLTQNFLGAQIDGSFVVNDQEMLAAFRFLLEKEGLLIGLSGALNTYGAMKWALTQQKPQRVVTVLCDHGSRYLSKVYNEAALKPLGLWPWPRIESLLPIANSQKVG